MESDEARGYMARLNTNKPSDVARAIAEDKFLWFVKKVGLNERGIDSNDVLDAIRPNEYGSLLEVATGTAAQLADIGRASAQSYLEAIISAVRNAIIVCRCSLFGCQRVLAEQFFLKKKLEEL